MPCKCKHQFRDHEWNFVKGKKQPCLRCSCKDYVDEKMPDIYMHENCPYCHGEIEIPRCSSCKHVKRNYLDYDNAKECRDCNLFHKNFEFNPNAEEDYNKIVEEYGGDVNIIE